MKELPAKDTGTPARSLPVLTFSAALIIEILVNAYILWFFLIGLPSECRAHEIETAGRETCGAGPALPIVVLVSTALIIAGLFLLYRWHVQKEYPDSGCP